MLGEVGSWEIGTLSHQMWDNSHLAMNVPGPKLQDTLKYPGKLQPRKPGMMIGGRQFS